MKGLLTFENLSDQIKHTESNRYTRKKSCLKKRKKKGTRFCCLLALFNSARANFSQKRADSIFAQHIFAPVVTLKDVASTSFSKSSSSQPLSLAINDKSITSFAMSTVSPTIVHRTPKSSMSFDPSLPVVSTPKSFLVHSYTSLSNYRIKSNIIERKYSLEEEIHKEECIYCSSANALPMKVDSKNNNCEQISLQSTDLLHAIEMYLSSNNASYDLFDLSSISSEQQATVQETKQLSLCEINEIVYAIHSDIENETERNEILGSLASSLRHIAEEYPVVQQEQTIVAADVPEQLPGLGQILIRALMYEIVMKLFSFYLLLLMYYGHLL